MKEKEERQREKKEREGNLAQFSFYKRGLIE